MTLPAYYDILGISQKASQDEIRTAYRKASLASHPDRFPNATAQQRAAYTARFQSVADAYYVLSDSARRAEYDALLRERGTRPSGASDFFNRASSPTDDGWDGATSDGSSTMPGDFYEKAEEEQGSSRNFFKTFFGAAAAAAGAAGAGSGSSQQRQGSAQPEAEGVFGDVFAELLRPEVERVAPIWKWVGSLSGAGLGFILGNAVGMVGGAVLGNRLGAIRDAKGKSVGQVFMSLGSEQKAQVLRALAAKILSQ